MILVDWSAIGLGMALGAVAAAAYFAGLFYGMRLALRAKRPIKMLLLSALIRIAALLIAGWGVAGLAGGFAFAGFAASFLIIRTITTTIARTATPTEDTP